MSYQVRLHLTTHPTLGPATWRQITAEWRRIFDTSGNKVCSWCHKPVTGRKSSRCGDPTCIDMIWRAYSWSHCRQVALRASRSICALCGARAYEVDHITPVCKGGTGDASNLRTLCRDCHQRVTNDLMRELNANRPRKSVAGHGQAVFEEI